jgi:hypothetical protein
MGPPSTCSLPFFTWIYVESHGQRKVSPICPIHPNGEVNLLAYGNGVVVSCSVNRHHVNYCTFEEFSAEQEQARAVLSHDAGRHHNEPRTFYREPGSARK